MNSASLLSSGLADSMLAFLDYELDEVDESVAKLRFELEGEVLHISSRTEAGWAHANPFCFGAVFLGQKMFGSESLQKLQRFVLPQPGGPYGPEFPYDRQVEYIQMYGPDELGVEIPEENALLLTKLYHSSFPLFWEWAMKDTSCVVYDGFYGQYLSTRYQSFYSETEYEKLVAEIFGVARRDTLRETRKLDIDQLSLAYLFKGLLPVDVIMDVLAQNEKNFFDFEIDRTAYQALKRLSPAITRRLMENIIETSDTDSILMRDALDMLLEVPAERLKKLKGVKTWEELHERTMKLVDVDAESESVITIPKRLIELAQADVDEKLKLVPLMRAEEFINVGNTLDICLGKSTYFSKARHGESYCMAGLLDHKPVIAIELQMEDSKWRVLQYRGSENSQPENSKTAITSIENFLNQ